MDHEIIREAGQEEAIGAHAGYRVRVVTRWVNREFQFTVQAYVRGSETEEEVNVDTGHRSFTLIQDAQNHGFAVATDYIDQQST